MIKKRVLSFLCYCFGLMIGYTQNLVVNSSFEEFTECPVSQGDFFVEGWDVAPNTGAATPDYFNNCAPADAQAGVPDNIAGTQEPQDGNAYVGVFTYGNDSTQRDYIQTQLNSSLIEGAIYRVSFYVSLPDRYRLASDGIGALLTVNPAEGNGTIGVIDMEPQVLADFIVTDRQNWTLITGTFTANGGEEYLTIGNFFFDEETQTQKLPPPGQFLDWTFYYIDSVSVVDVTLSIEENSLEDQIHIYPVPVQDQLHIEISDSLPIRKVNFYNIQDQKILSKEITAQNNVIDMTDFKSGIYFLEVLDDNGNKLVKRFLKE